jgi:E3 ubiquitin-protein ligase UBR2
MMTSGGGGYCDCGDPEAWKFHPSCELHMPKSNTAQGNDTSNYVSKLPQDLQQRSTQLFGFLLDYAFEILSLENTDELPAHLKPE